MHRILVAALSIVLILGASVAAAGRENRSGDARTHGGVHGFVRDAAGAAIPDASVLAIGATIVTAKSDERGRFELALPVGSYVLRATRSGYVSTYRESVRVVGATSLERVITLVRQNASAEPAKVTDSHAHTELAWQLRHLPRSVLRDGASTAEWTEPASTAAVAEPAGSLFWRAIDSSKRVASKIAATDFSGQLNFVTTASADPSSFAVSTLPRSVAYVVFGAPVGSVGDWRVRGAIGSGTAASWNVLGEYEAHRSEEHALRFGVSYSAHAPKVAGPGLVATRSALEARSVAGVFGQDRWRFLKNVEFDYAVRADRYDFLTSPYLLSATGGMRARVLPATFVTVRTGRMMLAPGAEEFQPPPSGGPWLPPERTFTSLGSRDRMTAETVRHVEVGVAREFGRDGRKHSLHVRAFQQRTSDQIATLFSTRATASPGHYRVARAGEVMVSGWAVGIGGAFTSVLSGTIEYARMAAGWDNVNRTRSLRRYAPSAVRDDDEWLSDVTATVEASLNDARTRVVAVYRANTAFAQARGDASVSGTRFDIQVHQALDARPQTSTRLELFFSIRNLFRDPSAGASTYDELLTVSPPLRFMGGIQVRF